MIGLEFKVKNEYGNFLQKIFASVDVQQFEWDIITDHTINGGLLSSGIFDSGTVDGYSFLSSISKKNYYMIFVDLKAYPNNSEHIPVETFEDFINSNCQVILLCVDSVFIEFYSKDEAILETVCKNCLDNNFEDVQFLSFKEVSRQNMNVL